ncbi:MAG: HD domain-containing protein [Spirochaetota bacterium]|nr:MAG: HD domain-containing protein [Spirochaetota bacterium]
MFNYSESCARLLLESGFDTYYAFETARDMLLNRRPTIINILTSADLSQLARLFPGVAFRKHYLEHAFVESNGQSVHFYVSDILSKDTRKASNRTEIRGGALKRAASYTPFLINGFFYDIEEEIFHDPLDAYSILKSKIIKANQPLEIIGETFPHLALKTAKVYCETGFSIDTALYNFIREKASRKIYEKMNEAVVQDFIKILLTGRASRAMGMLDEWGILEAILPEITALKEVDQDKDHHPEGNGFWHTLHCLRFVKKPNKNLMTALLLHDTGKAVTKENGKSSLPFPDHSHASTIVARRVLRRFCYPKEDIEEVVFLIKNHMILNAIDILPEKRINELFSSPYFPNLLELYRADLESGYHGIESYYHAARRYREFLKKEKLLRNGHYLSKRCT